MKRLLLITASAWVLAGAAYAAAPPIPPSAPMPPIGAAGGDLTGTYPNPTIKPSVALTTPDIGAASGASLNIGAPISSFSPQIQMDWQQSPNFLGVLNPPYYAGYVLAAQGDGTNIEYLTGMAGIASVTGTPPDNGGYISGLTGQAYYSGAGLAFNDSPGPNFFGVEASLINSGPGTVSKAAALHITGTKNLGGGAFTEVSGIYIDAQTAGVTNYAIYTAGVAPSRFSGFGQFGGASLATASPGEIVQAKATASGTAPGAGFLKFAVVAGATAGTCKIIAYAGTSTTPVDIVNNVGAGC